MKVIRFLALHHDMPTFDNEFSGGGYRRQPFHFEVLGREHICSNTPLNFCDLPAFGRSTHLGVWTHKRGGIFLTQLSINLYGDFPPGYSVEVPIFDIKSPGVWWCAGLEGPPHPPYHREVPTPPPPPKKHWFWPWR